MSICKKQISNESINNACEQLFGLMQETANQDVHDPEATAVVNKYVAVLTATLKETMNNFNVTLNEYEFKKLLLNIYTNLSSLQSGGTKQIAYGVDNKSHLLTHFKAFAALLSSIVLLYLAFNILNGLTCTLTGETILQYPQEAFKDVFTTTQEMTFLQYVWNSVSTLSSNVIGQQASYMTRILQTNMHTLIPDMTALVKETCMPQSTGLLGNAGRYLAGIMSPQPTSDCIVETSAELARQFLAAQEGKLALLAIQTKASFAQVIMLTRLGLGLGAASLGYFATVLTLPKSNRFEAIEEGDQRFLERGGRRKTRILNKRGKRTRRNQRPTN